MNAEKPLIHFFKTPYSYYIFDVNTNTLVKTEKNVYEYLYCEQKNKNYTGSEQDEAQALIQIEDLKSKNYLSSNRIEEIIHPDDEFLEYILDRKLKMLTLQVTQQCNLRCHYCAYSDSESNLQRNHSVKRMSWETAKRGIDFLISHSSDSKAISMAFYGGEPLLEFDLLKKCMEYATEQAEGKKLSFYITTNGTLITDEVITYLSKYDVSLTISLDGPKEIHDDNRKLAANGCGSFDIIMKNIEKLKAKSPKYFQKITFHAVIDTKIDLSCTKDFFKDYESLKDSIVNYRVVDDWYNVEKAHMTEDFKSKRDYEVFKGLLHGLGRLNPKHITDLGIQELNEVIALESQLQPTKKLPRRGHHSGPCIPGATRLFMDVEGNFLPCERVSESSHVMRIGHIDTGFDIQKARDLLNIGKLTEAKCKNCWAFSYCTMCAKFVDNVKELSAKLKSSNCGVVKSLTESKFLNYIASRELANNLH